MPTPDRRAPLLFIAIAALLLTGSALADPSVTASGAWIRLLPGNIPLAGYVTLHNHTNRPVKLAGAKSPAFKRIEMHRSMTMNGMDKMMPIKNVTVPADDSFSFAPGGYHLMMWRGRQLKAGATVPVTLAFADGQHLQVEFTIRGPGQ